jgi:ABC-type Fe3+ transport system permease subunit
VSSRRRAQLEPVGTSRLTTGKRMALGARLARRSKRRTRGLSAVALIVAGAMELIPLTSALQRGAVGPVFGLAWPEVETGLANSAMTTVGRVAGTLLLAVPAAYVLGQCRFPAEGPVGQERVC